jgi:lysophospholipid acyltransferase (LPLAT)-like uncharacterized protein
MITQVVRRLGFSVIRGSTTRGGVRALREMEKVTEGNLCFTPDGPRGPRRHVHQGMIYTASRLGLPIVGAGMAFANCWRATSWDRFAVPKPYSAAACVVPQAVMVPPDADRETLEAYRLEVERRMVAATAEAEAWAAELHATRSPDGRRGSAVPGPHVRPSDPSISLHGRRHASAERPAK